VYTFHKKPKRKRRLKIQLSVSYHYYLNTKLILFFTFTTIYKEKIMNLDELLVLMKKYTFTKPEDGELDEQDDAGSGAAASTGGGAAGYPTVTKWETGLTRSVANTIDDKVTWKSLNKIVRGKANTLL
jgi:hypothetical protein